MALKLRMRCVTDSVMETVTEEMQHKDCIFLEGRVRFEGRRNRARLCTLFLLTSRGVMSGCHANDF